MSGIITSHRMMSNVRRRQRERVGPVIATRTSWLSEAAAEL